MLANAENEKQRKYAKTLQTEKNAPYKWRDIKQVKRYMHTK